MGTKMLSLFPELKSTGIPRSFMMEVKDPNTKGAMLTNTGKYAIPTINAFPYKDNQHYQVFWAPKDKQYPQLVIQ
ncbi:E3 ubiquitin-protein ligase RBBP6-like [Calonectris borealis]|uniref:E3 ubiquitin-protein ligase RBBP6-like n=1 Tax=Calonectris borealis TaxID=1323832 RepID=UPI003F4C9790